MRRLGILSVVLLTIGIVVVGLAGVVAYHPARAGKVTAPDPTVTVAVTPPPVTGTPLPVTATSTETVTPSPMVVTPPPIVTGGRTVTPPPVTVTPSPVTVRTSPSQAAPWWPAALAAIGLLGIVTTGAVMARRVRRHRADLQRARVHVASHPDAGTVNVDRSEQALAHGVRLEPHADRGTPHLEDVP